jgi:hypothetical protein
MQSTEVIEFRIKKFLGLMDSSCPDEFNPFNQLIHKFEKSAIFGGAVRDIALFDPIFKPADIDIVIDCCEWELHSFFSDIQHTRNRFGGVRFKFNNQFYDVWCLNKTWAISQNYFDKYELNTLIDTTFFNIDAVFFSLFDRKIYARSSYIEDLQNRILDINFKPNPNPEGMARRALKYAITRNFSLSSALVEYILENMSLLIQTEFGFEIKSKLMNHLDKHPNQYCELFSIKKRIPELVKENEKKRNFPLISNKKLKNSTKLSSQYYYKFFA